MTRIRPISFISLLLVFALIYGEVTIELKNQKFNDDSVLRSEPLIKTNTNYIVPKEIHRRNLRTTIYGIGVIEKKQEGNVKIETTTKTHSDINSKYFIGEMSGETCSTTTNECCHDQDCSQSNNLCVNRNCIDKGYPRFTLEWFGATDLDLFVETPDGVTLSFVTTYDETTGGRVGETVDQNGIGHHTENTYFPLSGAPAGTYSYYVKPLNTVEGREEEWRLSVHDERGEVATHTGTGLSTIYTYERASETGRCDVNVDQCCENSDCSNHEEICAFRKCIRDGNPRFTLYWLGNDDYDLFVTPPGGSELSFLNMHDPVSGGQVGEEPDQFGSDYHVENTFFPKSGHILGKYQFSIQQLSAVAEAEMWTVEVVESGQVVMSESGYGASDTFTYHKTSTPSTPTNQPAPSNRPNMPPPSMPSSCSPYLNECCFDSDCQTSRDVCVQNTCIRDGNPRFTLTWEGDDDFDFFVTTPLNTEISSNEEFDAASGGRYQQDANQIVFGLHVENVYFPVEGAPTGSFSYGVRRNTQTGSDDRWTVRVWEGGELVSTEVGRGESDIFQYSRNVKDDDSSSDSKPPRCNVVTDECCFDSDCENEYDICVQRTCIAEGTPRITLLWSGDDDLNLSVITPGGQVVSGEFQNDPASGAQFKSNIEQTEFGFNVESVSFPLNGTVDGTIQFVVDPVIVRGSEEDEWHLVVYEGSVKMEDYSGFGLSPTFEYTQGMQSTAAPTLPSPSPSKRVSIPTSTPTARPTVSHIPTENPSANPTVNLFYCDPSTNECCETEDCDASQVCAQRLCINKGLPRFTLEWIGDDDLDLAVMTPLGTVVSFLYDDPESGGIFGTEGDQYKMGLHVESIYFPLSGGPEGTYEYFINSFIQEGEADNWTMSVYLDNILIDSKEGTGNFASNITLEWS